jgi:hypothetical protein
MESNQQLGKAILRAGGSDCQYGGISEIRLFIQAFPCLFPEMTHGSVAKLAKEMSLKQFAHHVALLSDNRLCKHDRALCVEVTIDETECFRQTFLGKSELPLFLEDVGDLTKLDMELRKSIEVEEEQKGQVEEENERQKKDYQSDSLVYALINGMKLYAKNIPGHPMARSSYRRTLKCLHRTLNPGSVWLTINISNKGNEWLKKMYGYSENGEPDYKTVKSGGVFQALFFDAHVQSFLCNVLKGTGLFGELDWAGGTIEWCQDGTSHLHLIAAMKCVASKEMAECFKSVDMKNRLEEWIGSLFCENNCHPDSGLLRVMEENGKLLHVHTGLYSQCNIKIFE